MAKAKPAGAAGKSKPAAAKNADKVAHVPKKHLRLQKVRRRDGTVETFYAVNRPDLVRAARDRKRRPPSEQTES